MIQHEILEWLGPEGYQIWLYYFWTTAIVTFSVLVSMPGPGRVMGSLIAGILGFVLWPFALAAHGVNKKWWGNYQTWKTPVQMLFMGLCGAVAGLTIGFLIAKLTGFPPFFCAFGVGFLTYFGVIMWAKS